MDILTDNFFARFLDTSTKTHDELNTFVNKKFIYYLNN